MSVNVAYIKEVKKAVESAIKNLEPIFPVLTTDRQLETAQQDIQEVQILLAQIKARLNNVVNQYSTTENKRILE